MSDWTPGPWALSKACAPLRTSRMTHHTIEMGSAGCLEVQQRTGPQEDGNARLIAAAPEMAKILNTLLDPTIAAKEFLEYWGWFCGIRTDAAELMDRIEGDTDA